PWLMLRLGRRRHGGANHVAPHGPGILGRLYVRAARPILKSRTRSWIFLATVGTATIASLGMFYSEHVTVKLLPFDNKTDLQIVVDLPEGSSIEDTNRVLQAAVDRAAAIPETVSFQTYAGTAAPFNFNGLVRHYYLRTSPELG